MSAVNVIGVDPGPVPGIVMLRYDGVLRAQVAQCTWQLAPAIVETLIQVAAGADPGAPVLLQVERFVIGRRSARSSNADAGGVTRDLIGMLAEVVLGTDVRMIQRAAGQVKPWATDVRLQAATTGDDRTLWTTTAGMRHARDAARHALFAAVHDGGVPDPLSKNGARA